MPVSRRRRGRAATRAARSGNVPRSNRRRKTNKLYLAACVTIAVLVIASFAFASFRGGGGSAPTGDAQGYVKGVGVEVEIDGRDHIAEGETATYANDLNVPPASGNHWPIPARCGFYNEQLPDERVVHNLEHGNIVVSYNLTEPREIDDLRDALGGIGLNRAWGVSRAYDKIPEGTIALAAWGVVDTLTRVDPDRIETFFETYAGALGPETFTC